MNHFSAFHYVVVKDNEEILDTLLAHERPMALSIINNLGFINYGINNLSSPLATAVGMNFAGMTHKLLEIGAKPEIGFDEWIKAYLARNAYAKNYTAEQNLQTFRKMVIQPIVSAAIKSSGPMIEDLLAHGADPNILVT
jgi:hypothetical protein